uniref:Uncharacterized protein n=1 Tax=Cannabis sativa TaxID=3483 RepID=A0A803QCK7_CANSA
MNQGLGKKATLTGTRQRVAGERRCPKKELEVREKEVMELCSAAMAAIVVVSLVRILRVFALLSLLPLPPRSFFRTDI